MDALVLPQCGFKEFVHDLALRQQVAYIQTQDDAAALALYKELNGVDADMSDTELLIIALYRARSINYGQMLELQCGYFKELYGLQETC